MHVDSAYAGLLFSASKDLNPLISFHGRSVCLTNAFQPVTRSADALNGRRIVWSCWLSSLDTLQLRDSPWLCGDTSFVLVVFEVEIFGFHCKLKLLSIDFAVFGCGR